MTHALERTSAKGEGIAFVGRCVKCGEHGLSMRHANQPCPADRLDDQDDDLIDAITREDES